ncbi:MAG: hypothetical protein DRG50_06495, partial [Deltaproteobacteria bacterium]
MKILKRKKTYWWLLTIPLILLMVGCAPKKKVEPPPKAIPPNLIKAIKVVEQDEGKRVVIEGESPLAYTFFKLIPQPLKLVVDIPQTGLAKEVPTTLTVGDEVIKEIVAIQKDEGTEIYISLNKLVKYQVQKEQNLLFIDIGKRSPLLAREEKKKEEIEIVEEAPLPAKEEAVAKELPPAKNLMNISVDKSQKDKIILKLKADGRLGDYNSFSLKKPTRLVIDIWKIKRKFRKKAIPVDSPYLKKVRLGDHPKKVRVVLDFPTKVLPPHRLDRIGDELMIVLGKEVKVEAAAPPKEVKEAKKEEMVPPPAPPVKKVAKKEEAPPSIKGEITGIEFKQLVDKSRIVISTSAKAPYEVIKAGEDMVLLEVKGMVVPTRFIRPLDTHEFASPVMMVTPTNIVIDSQKSARVLVKLRKMVAFDVQQEDSRIYIDFERPGELRVEKPKPTKVITVKKPPEVVKEAEKPAVEKKAEVVPAAPVTRVVPAAPMPGKEIQRKVYTGKRITLDFKDADIDNILRLFAEVSNLNIIATEDVKGKVTIRLVDVPWDQALDIILQANNLGMERIGNVIRIAPLERLRREKEARVKAIKAKEKLEPLVTELIMVSYSKASELAPKVKSLLSDRGSVVVDERTNTLIVKDIRANVEK